MIFKSKYLSNMAKTQTSFLQRFGLSGVTATENSQARLMGRLLEGPMLLLAGWIVIEWYLKSTNNQYQHSFISDWIIWAFFCAETLILLWLVDNKKRYLTGNWINLFIIVFSFPLIWQLLPHAAGFRALRLLILLSLFFQVSSTIRQVLARHNLGRILLVSLLIILVSGTVMSLIDPNVHSPGDGIWWAWVTVTTVGYGDIVPVSTAGRVFGALLILMGIGLFTMLTASFAAFFMAEDEKEIRQQQAENIQKLSLIEQRLLMMESKLDALLSEEQKQLAQKRQDNNL